MPFNEEYGEEVENVLKESVVESAGQKEMQKTLFFPDGKAGNSGCLPLGDFGISVDVGVRYKEWGFAE